MNSKVHPLFALLVIVLVVIAIGVGVWGSGQAKQFGGPAQLVTDPAGHLYVQMQNVLLEHDADGRFVRRHDLSELGVDTVLGAIGFFSNGDILLRRGADSRTLLDNIRAYMRLSNQKSLRSDMPKTGIYRCDLRTHACLPFGPELIDFNAAFGIFIDIRSDDVYISDTTRHILRKYSAAGESLGVSVDGFRFPNQLLIRDGRLYVADTNHHRVRIVEPGTATFGTELSSVDVVPIEAKRSEQTWPTHIARIGDEWWVNSMRASMAEGGIYIFDDDWVFRRKVDLPASADPIAIKPFGGAVLISDWNNDRIHRVATSGRLLGDFESPGLQGMVAESISLRWQYQSYTILAVIVFFLLIVALLIKGVTASSSGEPREKAKRQTKPAELPDTMIWIKPDAKFIRKIATSTRIAGFCLIALIPLLAYMIVATDNNLLIFKLVPPIIGIAAIFLLIIRVHRSNIKTAIGLRGNQVTLRDHAGRDSTCPIKDVIYNETTIASRDMAVFLGQPQMSVYDREELKAQVFPRLADAKSVSAWEMQKALVRMQHPHGLIALLAFIGILACGIWIAVHNMI